MMWPCAEEKEICCYCCSRVLIWFSTAFPSLMNDTLCVSFFLWKKSDLYQLSLVQQQQQQTLGKVFRLFYLFFFSLWEHLPPTDRRIHFCKQLYVTGNRKRRAAFNCFSSPNGRVASSSCVCVSTRRKMIHTQFASCVERRERERLLKLTFVLFCFCFPDGRGVK
jgi:hypothetical protein